jgi:hypothetical protein
MYYKNVLNCIETISKWERQNAELMFCTITEAYHSHRFLHFLKSLLAYLIWVLKMVLLTTFLRPKWPRCPKWYTIPYIVHYFWPGPIGHYIQNKVPFVIQPKWHHSYKSRHHISRTFWAFEYLTKFFIPWKLWNTIQYSLSRVGIAASLEKYISIYFNETINWN